MSSTGATPVTGRAARTRSAAGRQGEEAALRQEGVGFGKTSGYREARKGHSATLPLWPGCEFSYYANKSLKTDNLSHSPPDRAAMLLDHLFKDFDLDHATGPVIGIRLETADYGSEIPVHQHRQGQLILAMKGGVTREVSGAIWMSAAPLCRLGARHDAAQRPCHRQCPHLLPVCPAGCGAAARGLLHAGDLPLVQALILDMANQPSDYDADSRTGRKAAVLLEELATMPVEQLHLPMVRRTAHAPDRDHARRPSRGPPHAGRMGPARRHERADRWPDWCAMKPG